MLNNNRSFEKLFANEKIANFIGKLDKFFIRLPHLPKKVRIFINKIVPFLALSFGIIGLISTILTGFFMVIALISLDFSILPEITVSFLIIILDTLFLLKAFKPLKNGSAIGWIYLFWAEMMEIINLVIRTVNKEANVLLGILIIIFSFYLLFEIGQFYVYRTDKTN